MKVNTFVFIHSLILDWIQTKEIQSKDVTLKRINGSLGRQSVLVNYSYYLQWFKNHPLLWNKIQKIKYKLLAFNNIQLNVYQI